MEATPDNSPAEGDSADRPRRSLQLLIASLVVLIIAGGTWLVLRADATTNKVALSDSAKPVSVIAPRVTTFRPSRVYVGTIDPWLEAKIGPQLVSAYVDTVLVRPGAVVKKGDVLATLDCRNASAMSQVVHMQARALETRQKALANEAARVKGLLNGGFVSPNEAEQKEAQSNSELSQLLAQQAKLIGSTLEVNDCVLRAPFNGEVATRSIDPGAFVRPGMAIVSIVDRSILRVTADAPEVDFNAVAPGAAVTIHVLTTNQDFDAKISRRAPSADIATRTVHFELDVPDPNKTIPVNTTAEIGIHVGQPQPALMIPLSAAAVRGEKVSVFVVEGEVARARVLHLKGELAGELFLEPSLPAGARIVSEGRALLSDGDRVSATLDTQLAATAETTNAAGATL